MKIELKIRKDVLYIKIDDNPWIAKYIGPELAFNEFSWYEDKIESTLN